MPKADEGGTIAGMVRAWRLSLLVALAFTSALPAADSKPAAPTVTIHRCVDAKGHVTLQDDACPAGSQDSARVMERPKDLPASMPAPAPEPVFEPEPDWPPPPPRPPPPDMFVCTSYDGIERYSESYDPNPRCEPYVLYYPYFNPLTPTQALTCRWVQDSCVQLSDDRACAVWEQKRKDAESDVRRAFSDTAAYRKSELARINRIVEQSCR